MTTSDADREAEALDAYLQGKLAADHLDLPKAEAEFGTALKSAAQEIHAPRQFEGELERSLMREAQQKPSRLQRGLASAGRTAAWAGLVIALLVGLSWVFRTLLPAPGVGTGPTENVPPTAALPEVTEAPQVTERSVLSQPTPTVTGEAGPPTYHLPMFPGVEFVLQAELPESPGEVQIYQQKAWPALTTEAALQLAQQLGVDGQLYQAPFGPPGATSYLVSDGYAMVTVQQAVPWFLYRPALSYPISGGSNLPPEQAIVVGEAFLKAHGLDGFEYRAEVQAEQPGQVLFLQTLDSFPVRYSQFDAAKVRVQIDDRDQVTQVESSLGNFETLGSYPIISAQEAWEKVLSPGTIIGLESSEISGLTQAKLKWQREYPLNTRVELFGYAQSYPAVDPNLPPLILFKEHPVSGNTQGLVDAAANNRFVQAWGQFQEDDQGRRSFQIEGWQASFFPDQSMEGSIERYNGRTYLVTADQQRLLLPDAPDDLPEGKIISAHGVTLEEPEPTLEWSNLYAGPPRDGGGGGGSGFAELNLEGPPSTAAAPAQPTQLEPTPNPIVSAGQARKAVIDRIELVYQTEDPRYRLPSVEDAPLYVQPVWRFSGRYEDGASFIILVQALKPEFLK